MSTVSSSISTTFFIGGQIDSSFNKQISFQNVLAMLELGFFENLAYLCLVLALIFKSWAMTRASNSSSAYWASLTNLKLELG